MKKIYEKSFTELTELVRDSRNNCIRRTDEFFTSVNSVLNLGDTRFISYSNMVGTSEMRAVKVIERLAVTLIEDRKIAGFSLYPVDLAFRKMDLREQAKSRPFQLVLEEGDRKYGIIFCVPNDEHKYYSCFTEGKYAVNGIKFVKLIDPDKEAYNALIQCVNDFNKRAGILVERVTIREFWTQYFGHDEFDLLIEFLNAFNEKAKEIIGFSTVVTPTDTALKKFRAKTGEILRTTPYASVFPDSVYQPQIDIMTRNYLDRGLWKAMVGTEDFAISFITSEWNFQMYELTENMDLTNIVAGYLKSVEQLLWTIIRFQTKKPFQIKAKNGGLIEYSANNEDVVNTTLGSLEEVLIHNSWMFDVNYYARTHVTAAIKEWRTRHRNGFFHKDNLQTIDKVQEIRSQTLQLYFLILGSCSIGDEDFAKLGIEATT